MTTGKTVRLHYQNFPTCIRLWALHERLMWSRLYCTQGELTTMSLRWPFFQQPQTGMVASFLCKTAQFTPPSLHNQNTCGYNYIGKSWECEPAPNIKQTSFTESPTGAHYHPQRTVFRYDIPKKGAKPQDIGKTREGLWSIFDGGVHTHLFCSVVVADQTGFWSSKKAFKPFERSRQRKSVSYAVRHPSYRFQQDEKNLLSVSIVIDSRAVK